MPTWDHGKRPKNAIDYTGKIMGAFHVISETAHCSGYWRAVCVSCLREQVVNVESLRRSHKLNLKGCIHCPRKKTNANVRPAQPVDSFVDGLAQPAE